MKSIPYETPELPTLLTISSYIYLLNIAETALNSLINAGLIGSLALGIIFGPEASNLLPDYIQHAFILLGYIGLLLLVFEAGLSTDISLLYHNIFLSLVVALTGVGLPIALSLLLLAHGYGYSLLQAFGAGAALCSTSLGTTLALLRPELRQTKTGAVLLSAALLDDIIGLVFAAIIPNLPYEGSSSPNSIAWYTVARPILVSLAFAFGTPVLAYIFSRLLWKSPPPCRARFFTRQMQLLLIVSVTSGFVAGARYAGTSELFGAYLAGAFLSYIFSVPTFPTVRVNTSQSQVPCLHDMNDTFAVFIQPLLRHIFSPIFFASIGTAIPIRSLVFVDGSRRVIWRGIVYSFLMILAKAIAGAWMLVQKVSFPGLGWCYRSKKSIRSHKSNKKELGNDRLPKEGTLPSDEMNDGNCSGSINGLTGAKTELTHTQSATLVALAMVARGEIALIVAQLARPLLVGGTFENNSEAYAVVIWAILTTTVSGALGVGLLLRSWDKKLK